MTTMAGTRAQVLAVALLGAALYVTTLGNGFVMDDGYNVVRNVEIRSLTHIPDLLTRPIGAASADSYERSIGQSFWRPLTMVTYAVDHAVWGLRPLGFHLTNVLLYGLLCGLVTLALRLRLGSSVAATVGGTWYAVHPVHAEAVNLVTYRTELLAGVAVAGALALHAADGGRRRLGALVGIAGLYAVGLLSKESAATLPVWLLASELLLRSREGDAGAGDRAAPAPQGGGWRALGRRPWWALHGTLAVTAIAWLAARAALVTPGDVRFFGDLEGPLLFMSVMKIYGLYVRMLLFPWPQTPFYDWTIVGPAASLADPEALAGLAALVVTGAAVWVLRRRAPAVALGLGCWLVGLLPFAQLVPLPVGAAERFLLIPTIGVALAGGAVAATLWARRPALRRSLAIGGAVLGVGYAGLVLARNPDWHDDLRLQEATVAAFPESFNAWHVLGELHLAAGRPEEAARALGAAEALLPGFPPNTALLARALLDAGRPAEAIAALDAAIARIGGDPALVDLRAQAVGALR